MIVCVSLLYCMATGTALNATVVARFCVSINPISVTVTRPDPGANATNVSVATEPEPFTPADPAARDTVSVA